MAIQDMERYHLKLKALHYLYEKDYTQADIARMLNISRVTLGKLLKEARDEGMVKIEIVDVRNISRVLDLEEKLRTRFGLREVKLIDCEDATDTEILDKLAWQAASFFERYVRSEMKIGITWGRTLNAMVNHLTTNRGIRGLEVYTLVGSTSSDSAFQPNVLAQKLISKYEGQARILTAPFFCYSRELCEAIKQEPGITDILDIADTLDLILVGIGEAPSAGSGKLSDYPFDESILEELVASVAAGDICGNFFDIDGRRCQTEMSRRTVSVELEKLKKNKNVVGVGGGSKKVRSILGALNGGYLDVLITDYATARAVWSLAGA